MMGWPIQDVVRLLFGALSQGCIYGLVGIGFSLIYNTTGIINFAQGEFVMLGGVLAYCGLAFFNLSLPEAVSLSIAMTMLIGWALQRSIVAPLRRRRAPAFSYAFTLFGVSIILSNLVLVLVGSEAIIMPPFTPGPPILVFGAAIERQSLWLIGTTMLVTGALTLFWTRTILGKAMRAAAMDPVAAQLVGIPVEKIISRAYVLSAFFGAIAGAVAAPIILTGYNVGLPVLVKGFIAAIIGGFGSVFGALIGGLFLALVESYSTYFLSSAYRDVISFFVMITVLIAIPNGLFGRRSGHHSEV